MHLFTYNYRRPWPTSLDFKAILTAFTFVPAALSLLIRRPAPARARHRGAARGQCAVGRLGRERLPLQGGATLGSSARRCSLTIAITPEPDELRSTYQMNWKEARTTTPGTDAGLRVVGGRSSRSSSTSEEKGVTPLCFATENTAARTRSRARSATTRLRRHHGRKLNNSSSSRACDSSRRHFGWAGGRVLAAGLATVHGVSTGSRAAFTTRRERLRTAGSWSPY